jgi:cyanobactin maturation PatA/PatG family protease
MVPAAGCGCAACQAKADKPTEGCGCAACQAKATETPARPATAAGGGLVFALGQIGFDLVSEARRDSIAQHMGGPGANPWDPSQMLAYLQDNPWEAASITWTLGVDQTPLYAIAPNGPYAARGYELLREFLDEQSRGEIELVSIPGRSGGRARLFNGQVVPVVYPELRGVYSWATAALVRAVVGEPPAESAPASELEAFERKSAGVRGFLQKVYYELRNLGITAEERALNYAATNAFEVERIFEAACRESMELDAVEVERSRICRPDSDCWDVKLYFFYPERQVQTVRKAFRLTVDVSDIVPVTVGPMRSWYIR